MKKCNENYHLFIENILQQYNNITISNDSKDILNNLIKIISEKYINASINLCKYSKKATIDFKAIETLTMIWIDDPKDMLAYIETKLTLYLQDSQKNVKKKCKANLILPPIKFFNMIKDRKCYNQLIGETSYIYLCALIEYILRIILIEANEKCVNDNNDEIKGIYIYNSLNSEKLNKYVKLFNNIFIAGFGYIGNTKLIESQKIYLIRDVHKGRA